MWCSVRVVLKGGLASGVPNRVKNYKKVMSTKMSFFIFLKGRVKKRMYHQMRAVLLHSLVHPFFYAPFEKAFFHFFRKYYSFFDIFSDFRKHKKLVFLKRG